MQQKTVPRSSGVAVCIQRVFIPLFTIRNHLNCCISKKLVKFSPSKGLNEGSKMLIYLLR